MKVYVLRSNEYNLEISGVFSTREKAEEAREILEIDGWVETFPIDEAFTYTPFRRPCKKAKR